MCSGIDSAVNAAALCDHIKEAAKAGADILFTPEMTGMVDRDRKRAAKNIQFEKDDPVLAAARGTAAENKIWVAIGSLALKTVGGKWVNRSILVDPRGEVAARYDKIHLFDVDIAGGDTWRESAVYSAGIEPVVVPAIGACLGLSICYDLRFPMLYQVLTNVGANILSIPAAFTVPTGKAHWETLLRARAIESAAFVVAAAQCGQHEDGRQTYGHSMVVDPWGEILLDMGDSLGLGICDIDFNLVSQVRSRIPVIEHRRQIPEIGRVK
ncbi:FIG147869: Carbon-nitrogen hydrolase / Aliphatic amidase AmiE [hydrothermal vent metagenome]|uniref:FIG147869: Carbon-nitrogen hydrolase / Aliphatic amidase AmiE n=1 Tax=hydrothermal vent metagenome TaxID=652676 RepID=A0A3B0S8H7_9ZZZZ